MCGESEPKSLSVRFGWGPNRHYEPSTAILPFVSRRSIPGTVATTLLWHDLRFCPAGARNLSGGKPRVSLFEADYCELAVCRGGSLTFLLPGFYETRCGLMGRG